MQEEKAMPRKANTRAASGAGSIGSGLTVDGKPV